MALTNAQRGVTLALLMDRKQRLEIGARMKDLRERSGLTQWQVAEQLPGQTPDRPMTARNYQKMEEKGTTKMDLVEQLAKFHWETWAKHDPEYGYVSAGWIWDGKDRRQTPDVLRSLNGSSQEQLDRIEAKLDEILKNWDARWALLEATDVGPESAPAEQQPARESRATHR